MGRTLRVACQTNAWALEAGRPNPLIECLRQIRGLGFSGFETSYRNLFGLREDDRKVVFQGNGLVFSGVHIFLHEYDSQTGVAPAELVSDTLRIAAQWKAEGLILSGETAADKSRVTAKADALTRYSGDAERNRMQLAYHNHASELLTGELDDLMSLTDPEKVYFILDAGHAFRAAQNVPDLIRAHHSRLSGLHLRDFSGDRQVPLGSGEFPLSQIAQAVRETNWAGWLIAEEERVDGSKPGLSAVEPAREAIRQAFGC